MLEPDGPPRNCPADIVLSPGSILEQFLSQLAFIPTRKNVSFIFVSFPSRHEFKIFYLNFFFCFFKVAELFKLRREGALAHTHCKELYFYLDGLFNYRSECFVRCVCADGDRIASGYC